MHGANRVKANGANQFLAAVLHDGQTPRGVGRSRIEFIKQRKQIVA